MLTTSGVRKAAQAARVAFHPRNKLTGLSASRSIFVTFVVDALVPVVEGIGRELALDRVQVGVFAGRLVEVAVDGNINSGCHPLGAAIACSGTRRGDHSFGSEGNSDLR